MSLPKKKSTCYKIKVNSFERTPIGKPEQWLIEAGITIGLDFSGLAHEVTNYFKNHVIKRHGQDPLEITENDFSKIPAIVKTPDMAIIGAIRGGLLFNAYAKRDAGVTYLYFDEVMDSNRNKTLRSRTFYKIAKNLDMDGFVKIVTMNEKSDVSKAVKIIAAGGHPGGEA